MFYSFWWYYKWNCLSLVYKNIVYFSILVLCSATLLNLLLALELFWWSPWDILHIRYYLWANIVLLPTSQSVCLNFFFFFLIALARTWSKMLNRSGDSIIPALFLFFFMLCIISPALFLILGQKILVPHSPASMMLAMDFSYTYVRLVKLPSSLTLLRLYIMNECWIFLFMLNTYSNTFSLLSLYFVFCLINMLCYIN